MQILSLFLVEPDPFISYVAESRNDGMFGRNISWLEHELFVGCQVCPFERSENLPLDSPRA